MKIEDKASIYNINRIVMISFEKYATPDFWKKVSILSLLCAIMIVTMHTINNVSGKYENSPVTDSVLQFVHWMTHNAVKLFWMLSALLFYRNYTCNEIISKYKSRFKSLVIPYLSWNTISMLLFGLIGLVPLLANQLNSLEPFTLSVENVLLGLFQYN
ncbi:MAG: acyltransferase family protein, partial [Agathobacter sp.]